MIREAFLGSRRSMRIFVYSARDQGASNDSRVVGTSDFSNFVRHIYGYYAATWSALSVIQGAYNAWRWMTLRSFFAKMRLHRWLD